MLDPDARVLRSEGLARKVAAIGNEQQDEEEGFSWTAEGGSVRPFQGRRWTATPPPVLAMEPAHSDSEHMGNSWSPVPRRAAGARACPATIARYRLGGGRRLSPGVSDPADIVQSSGSIQRMREKWLCSGADTGKMVQRKG